MQEENKAIKGFEFGWKNFFRIVGSVFFIGLGLALGVNSEWKIWQLAISFAVGGIGIALMLMDLK